MTKRDTATLVRLFNRYGDAAILEALAFHMQDVGFRWQHDADMAAVCERDANLIGACADAIRKPMTPKATTAGGA